MPCGPINNLAQVFADPQVQHRGTRVEMSHPLAGSVPQVANPIRFSGTPVEYRSAPPTLGADTRAVLGEMLNLSDSALDALAAAKVIA